MRALQSLPQFGQMKMEGVCRCLLAFAFLLARFTATVAFHLLSPFDEEDEQHGA